MDILTFSGVAPPPSLLKNCSIYLFPWGKVWRVTSSTQWAAAFLGSWRWGGEPVSKGFSWVGIRESVGMKFGYIRFFWFRNLGWINSPVNRYIKVYSIIYQVVFRFSSINSVFEIVWSCLWIVCVWEDCMSDYLGPNFPGPNFGVSPLRENV